MEPEDFSERPESELAKDVFAHFGAAVYFAQVLEHQLVNMLAPATTVAHARPSREILDASFDEHFTLTFGNMIKLLIQLFQIPDEISSLLQEAKTRRDWLVHHYFRENILLMRSRAGCLRLVEELEEYQEHFRRADRALTELGLEKEFWHKLGIPRDKFDEYVKKWMHEQEAEARALIVSDLGKR